MLKIEEISIDKKVPNKLVKQFRFLKASIIPENGYIYVYGISQNIHDEHIPMDFFFDDNFNTKDPYQINQQNLKRDLVGATLDLRDFRLAVIF